MKNRTWARVLIVAGIALAAASAASAGETPTARPFWGSVKGETTFPLEGVGVCDGVAGWWAPVLTTVAGAEGRITHLGLVSYSSTHCPTYDGRAELGSAVFTAANGDEIWATYRADTVFPPPPLVVQEGEYTIFGGTGRFADASGRVRLTAYVTFEGFEDPSWPIEIVVSGTIVY